MAVGYAIRRPMRSISETCSATRCSSSVFTQALADLGWTVGRNLRMGLRWGRGDNNRIRALAQELVGLQPDIIATNGTPATVAVQRETRTVPIVFMNVGAAPLSPRGALPGMAWRCVLCGRSTGAFGPTRQVTLQALGPGKTKKRLGVGVAAVFQTRLSDDNGGI